MYGCCRDMSHQITNNFIIKVRQACAWNFPCFKEEVLYHSINLYYTSPLSLFFHQYYLQKAHGYETFEEHADVYLSLNLTPSQSYTQTSNPFPYTYTKLHTLYISLSLVGEYNMSS